MAINSERSDRAYQIMLIYAQKTNFNDMLSSEDNMETLISDLITDLRHMGGDYAVDFQKVFDRSEMHFTEELAGRE
jgi:hypothetical protein